MGMYTEIFFRATLKRDIPEEVLNPLRVMVGEIEAEGLNLPAHELFRCSRWDMLGRGGSYYFPEPTESLLAQEDIRKAWCLRLHANIKNYGGEIEAFFDWIDPYVDAYRGEFIGYSLYEENEPETPPTIYYKK